MNWAIIDLETNVVVNMILWDGISKWNPPVGFYIIDVTGIEQIGIDWTYDVNTETFLSPLPTIDEAALADPNIQTEPVVL